MSPGKFGIVPALRCVLGAPFLCMDTIHMYLKCLHLATSEKYDIHTGSYQTAQFSCEISFVSVAYINKAKKQAELKSTVQRSKPLREARLECE